MRSGYLSAIFALLCWTLQPVLAQTGLPLCAVSTSYHRCRPSANAVQATCFQSAVEKQTACEPTDVQCICTNAPLQGAIQECVAGSCTVRQTLSMKSNISRRFAWLICFHSCCKHHANDVRHRAPRSIQHPLPYSSRFRLHRIFCRGRANISRDNAA